MHKEELLRYTLVMMDRRKRKEGQASTFKQTDKDALPYQKNDYWHQEENDSYNTKGLEVTSLKVEYSTYCTSLQPVFIVVLVSTHSPPPPIPKDYF